MGSIPKRLTIHFNLLSKICDYHNREVRVGSNPTTSLVSVWGNVGEESLAYRFES